MQWRVEGRNTQRINQVLHEPWGEPAANIRYAQVRITCEFVALPFKGFSQQTPFVNQSPSFGSGNAPN